jgi:hypothetical protein
METLLNLVGVATKLKQLAPGIVVIGRMYQASQPMDGDPAQRAQDWWQEVSSFIPILLYF